MGIRGYLARVLYRAYRLVSPDSSERFTLGENDVLLVSYPRSGNTWLRVIMAELLYGQSGESIKGLDYFVPDLHERPSRNEIVPGEFHIAKSHTPYRTISPRFKDLRRGIYLIRDPRDVVLSYYRYGYELQRYIYSFEHFVNDWLYGRIWPCTWQEHVNSWTGDGIQTKGLDIITVRYEDLLLNAEEQMGKVLEFLNINKNLDEVKRALDNATIEKMREKEARGMRDKEQAEEFRFIGEGVLGQWEGTLSDEQLSLISRYAGEGMERFEYG
jgi:hypothetical protein